MLNKRRIQYKTLLLWTLLIPVAHADSVDQLQTNLQRLVPDQETIGAISETPMEGVYEVGVGKQQMYVYSKGDFVLIGDVYDAARKVNLREEKNQKLVNDKINSMPEDEMIIMGDVDAERYVTVFTDTTCVYCMRFHAGMQEMAEAGLKVRYLMYPRAGVNSKSYNDAVSIWCSEKQGEAMTIAKTGGTVDPLTCENPVADQYQLGHEVGVRGTPTLILDTGKVVPGYLPPDALMAEMGM